MFGTKPKLPISEAERLWVDEGFRRLGRLLGRQRLLDCVIVLPSDEYFPDHYDSSDVAARSLCQRVCGFMGVDSSQVDLHVMPDSSELMKMLPEYRYESNDPAGLYFGSGEDGRSFIALKQSQLKDPLSAVATIAHELGHVILLGGGHLARDSRDMEPMTDLVTVFLGMGLFTANSARRFLQYQDDRHAGWSMKHQGYLPEEVFGYALARFAKERGEYRPAWIAYLSTNLKAYFKQSESWLAKNPTL